MPEARTILRIDRERSSRSGNPRFRFTFTDGSMAKSAPDAGWAYAVGNRGMREGSTVALEFDGRDNIRVMREAPDRVARIARAEGFGV
jgi:hypothetical protein